MSPDPPRTTHFDKSTCGFSSWYEDFKSVSIRSVIIPLPEDFVQGYLLQDGIVLPLDANGQAQPSYLHPDKDTIDHESITSESDDEDNHREISSGSSSITSNDHTMPNFPQLQEDIDEAIKSLGGHVFPKLNWSSPKDATWIATEGNLKCSNYSDVFLLLKSSDFVTHDLTCAFEAFEASTSISDSVDVSSLLSRMNIKEDGGGESILSLYGNNSSNTASTIPPTSSQTVRPRQFELILRKWCNLSRSMEFRCFVRNSQLIAITQRDYTNYYDFLVQEKDTLEDLILDFFDDHISDKFPLSNYTFDVYINKSNHKVWILDFNPYHPTTDSLLFSWTELNQIPISALAQTPASIIESSSNLPVFRLVESQGDADFNSAHQPAYATNRVPRDVIDLSSGVNAIEYMQRVMKALDAGAESSESDEEDGKLVENEEMDVGH